MRYSGVTFRTSWSKEGERWKRCFSLENIRSCVVAAAIGPLCYSERISFCKSEDFGELGGVAAATYHELACNAVVVESVS
jgi:hypothetical protein